MEGLFEIGLKRLTFLNKINRVRKPKLANEKIKKKKQKNGIMVTSLYNKNISGLISSYNIPLLKIKQKRITMSI